MKTSYVCKKKYVCVLVSNGFAANQLQLQIK